MRGARASAETSSNAVDAADDGRVAQTRQSMSRKSGLRVQATSGNDSVNGNEEGSTVASAGLANSAVRQTASRKINPNSRDDRLRADSEISESVSRKRKKHSGDDDSAEQDDDEYDTAVESEQSDSNSPTTVDNRSKRNRRNGHADASEDAADADRTATIRKQLDKHEARAQRTERKLERIARGPIMPAQVKNRYATAGVIERVELTNFLCHEHLEIELHPHVNFVTGRNGSGKSAILAALIVGLGGSAKHTGRAQSLKDFIRHSRTSAEVSVTIANRGDDAYKHREFGNRIVVTRTILLTKDGQSATGSYRIFGESGRAVRSSRKELDSILDHFNIYVDNPAVMLTQETARTFLATQKPEDRYKFLMDGALITRLEEEYEATDRLREIFGEQMGKRAKQRMQVEGEKKQAEKQLKAVRVFDELEMKARRLKLEIAFAEVRDAQAQLDRATGARENLNKQLDSRNQQITEYKDKIKLLEKQKNDSANKVMALAKTVDELVEQGASLRAQERTKHAEIDAANDEVADLTRQSSAVKRAIAKMEERIREMQSSERNDKVLKQRAEHDRRVESLTAEVEKLRSGIRELEQKRDSLPSSNDIRRDQIAADARSRRIQDDIQRCRGELEAIRRAASGANRQNAFLRRACAFGPVHADILRMIESQPTGTFQTKPIGPLGAYMHLREERWGPVIQQCLNSLLPSYVVTSSTDQLALSRIFRELRAEHNRRRLQYRFYEPSIIIQQFRHNVYDVSSERPATNNYPTMLEMLDIENPVVANVLIDNAFIERTLLIANSEECRRVMRAPPRNTSKAYDLTGTQVMPAPNFRIYGSEVTQRCSLQTRNATEDTRELEMQVTNELRKLEADLSECEKQSRATREALAASDRSRQAIEAEVRQLLASLNEKRSALSELRNQVPVDVVSSLDSLREELAARIAERDRHAERLDDRTRFITSAKAECQTLAARFNETKTRLEVERRSAEPLTEQRNAIEEELTATRDSLNRFIASIKESDARRSKEDETVRRLEVRVTEAQNNAERELQKFQEARTLDEEDENGANAEVQTNEVETLRNTQTRVDELKSSLRQCESERSELARQNMTSREEVERQYRLKRDAFRKANEAFATGRDLVRNMKEAQRIRAQRLVQLRAEITNLVIERFKQTVQLRGFPCQMRADHDAKKLHLFIDPNVSLNPETLMAQTNNNNRPTASQADTSTVSKRRGLLSNDTLRNVQTQRLAEETQLVAMSQPTGAGARVMSNTKGYSGGERSFATVNFLLALWEAIETPVRCMDEFDVYMDIYNRRFCIELLKVVAGHDRTKQYIFLTPQDLTQVEVNEDCRLVRMRDHHVDNNAASNSG